MAHFPSLLLTGERMCSNSRNHIKSLLYCTNRRSMFVINVYCGVSILHLRLQCHARIAYLYSSCDVHDHWQPPPLGQQWWLQPVPLPPHPPHLPPLSPRHCCHLQIMWWWREKTFSCSHFYGRWKQMGCMQRTPLKHAYMTIVFRSIISSLWNISIYDQA